jgi:GTPase involved in cell partitioning and DNA repair
MLAQAREKFSQIAGPQGGGSLNGSALKAEATAELEALEKEVATGVPSGANAGGYSFLIG